ncbi:zinc finger MYM-type protein 1-like [Zingiber officinale]|uniref:zinc finger MYM-type protein 1-like n=1 Tax=Zingiber officinale TaxID=94328 RepID=UPI001C4D0628|nr:zinc finger MYM-type protein 1-like [Zingiber officinale]
MNENAPGNNQMKSPTVQKDLTRACAAEVTNVIHNDIKDNIFSLMVDECRDISVKEQMGVVLRYVNKHGCVIERFLAIVHVSNTSAISLKKIIDELFAKHKLSLSRLRGQGYDEASNMRGESNGLKALILKENSSARYVHCFAHQLQLVVVAVAKSNRIMSDFFQYVTMIVNITGASCKRKDKFRQLEHDRLIECLEKGDIVSGKGKNQEISLKQPGDTRWGSHYMTIICLMSTWTSVLQVLENVYDDGTNDDNSDIPTSLIDKMESYEFVFVMHLMKSLLGIINELSLALQQKDQNIVLAVSLIKTMKVLDMMVQEMSNRFSESSKKVLTCIACLNLKDSFSQFDIGKLLHLAKLYPEDFSLIDRAILEDQIETYIQNVRGDFSMIEYLGSLAKKMVETGKNTIFPLVYRLIELALVLPIATTSVERVFSTMKIIKTDLRNRMGDEWMNDSLVKYIEKDIFATIENEQILQYFQQMNTRRIQLSPLVCMSRSDAGSSTIKK